MTNALRYQVPRQKHCSVIDAQSLDTLARCSRRHLDQLPFCSRANWSSTDNTKSRYALLSLNESYHHFNDVFYIALQASSSERRANARNVTFVISSRWKFDLCQLVSYQILVFHLSTDAAPPSLTKLTFQSLDKAKTDRCVSTKEIRNLLKSS